MCIEFARSCGAQLREAFPDVVQAELTRLKDEENGGKDDSDAVPSMCEELKAQGNKEFKAGNFNEAIVKYTEALTALGPPPNRPRSAPRLEIRGAVQQSHDEPETWGVQRRGGRLHRSAKAERENVKAYLRRAQRDRCRGTISRPLTTSSARC